MEHIGGRHLHQVLRHLLLTAAALCVAAAVTLGAAAPVVHGMAPNLTGKMARWRMLIGDWTCTSGSGSNGMTSTVSFQAAPNNTLQVWARSPEVDVTGFFGFDAISGTWWSAYTDSAGARTYETSSDGKTFTGTVSLLHHTDQIRSTTTQIGPTKFRSETEIRSGEAWSKTTGATTCTKS